jgi:tRNA (cytidine/uridine-2'-O-)-methyltransferase
LFNIILYQPEIPPNTGNIIRLCANTGCSLHLIGPLGFHLDDKQVRRAGLDYHDLAAVRTYRTLEGCLDALGKPRVIALTTKGGRNYADFEYSQGDALLFGPETRGLPVDLLEELGRERWARIPMLTESRSLNLSNAVAIVVYEAWRRLGFLAKA